MTTSENTSGFKKKKHFLNLQQCFVIVYIVFSLYRLVFFLIFKLGWTYIVRPQLLLLL
jgi:hypothetical protein